jgi:hypothetical protein
MTDPESNVTQGLETCVPFAKRIVTVLAGLLALSMVAPAAANHENGDHPFGDPRFEERRDRTERPVIEGDVDRTWVWGPTPHTDAFMEPYADSPGGERMVQYFDKSRMEINDPDAEGLWAVTNGLLVVEMVDGAIQTGDNEFDHSPDPADVQIAGDAAGSESPTYADIASFELQNVDPLAEGTVISEYLAMTSIEQSQEYAAHGIEAAYHVSETNHTVAAPFWEFMNSAGLVWVNGELMEDDLFQNPFYATGYPITEAYWTTTPVDGESQDILWQCFERRCMTYTPENPAGWQVETGNVGQHYYEWRYGDDDAATKQAVIYLSDIEAEEMPGDSLVPVEVDIPAQENVEGRIAAALEVLFHFEHETLYNEWTAGDTNVTVADVTITDGLATVNLSGEVIPVGDLSSPRLEAQLEYTAMQFDEVDRAIGLLHGGPLTEPLATPHEGVVAIFDVHGEQIRVWTTNEDTINDLYALQAGESDANIPNGPIAHGNSPEGAEPVNVPWSWHYDPEQVEMAEVTIEVCDGTPSFVEANVDYFVEDVGQYCPWSAELVEIVDYRDS